MKKLRTSGGPLSFDNNEKPGEYDPDASLVDKDVPETFVCEVCGEQMTRTGDGWTCPNCYPAVEPGEME